MANTSFATIGNLQFYDDWSPNFVYFSSLLRYAQTNKTTGAIPSTNWDSEEAKVVAAKAVQDANSHSTFYADSKDLSDDFFKAKFNLIIDFLKQAYAYERSNEMDFFTDLAADFTQKFQGKADAKLVNKILEILNSSLKDPQKKFDHGKFITLINILYSDIETTRAIIRHEAKRIKTIEDIYKKLEDSRIEQVKGLVKAGNLPIDKFIKMKEDAIKRLRKKTEIEYINNARLTRKENGRYVLFGGKLFSETPQAVDRIIADWANQTVNQILEQPQIVEAIAKRFQVNYPINGDFNLLKADIQEIIIQATIQFGLKNLKALLQNDVAEALSKQLEQEIVDNESKIFNFTNELNIKGLDNTFGRRTKDLELFDTASTLKEAAQRDATQLYETMKNVINKSKKIQEGDPIIIQAMKHSSKNSNKKSVYEQTEEMISLITAVEKLYQEVEKTTKAWKKLSVKEELAKELQVSTSRNKNISIKISMVNGEVNVDMKDFLEQLKNTSLYQEFEFKTFNPQTLKTTITSLKARASTKLKERLISSLKSFVKDKTNNLTESNLLSIIQGETRSLTIDVNGPTLAELIPGLRIRKYGKGLVIDWNRYKGKNDMVVIKISSENWVRKIETSISTKLVGSQLKEFKRIMHKDVENAALDFLSSVQEMNDKKVKELTASNDMEKYSKMIETTITDVRDFNQLDKEVAKKKYKFNAEIKKLIDWLKTEGGLSNDDLDMFTDLQDYTKALIDDTFQVSKTVKSANTYMNDIGFKGGTLGSFENGVNLDAQLARVADIFNTAGMPIDPKEYEWLRSAIINCFPGSVVKEKNKGLIENYLGALMAFALFDEGGAEAAIISDYYKTYFQSLHKSKGSVGRAAHGRILHLYIVDGIYVPGSVVIYRTLNTIQKQVIPQIASIPETMHRGAGITIINPAKEKTSVPNRPIKKHIKNANPWAWTITGENVAKDVELKILFLAGLMDIIKHINKTLGDTEIPK